MVGISCLLGETADRKCEDFNLIPSYVKFSGENVGDVTKASCGEGDVLSEIQAVPPFLFV